MSNVKGTPLYMAPEQCRGAERVTDKTDVYSLGVMLFQMLSGQTPFSGEGMGDLMVKHLMEPPPELLSLEPSLPAELGQLVHRMLSKKPEERPTMPEVVAELERLGADRTGLGTEPRGSIRPLSTAPENPSTLRGSVGELPGAKGPSRHRGVLLAVAGVGVVGLCGALLVHGHGKGATPVAAPPTATTTAPASATTSATTTHFTLSSEPKGAQIIRVSDGQVLGRTPLAIAEEHGQPGVKLLLRLPGYSDKQIQVDLSRDGSRNEVLVPQSDKEIKLLE